MTGKKGLSIGQTLTGLLTFIFLALTGCDYARMYDQDAVKTYERKITAMDKRAVPVTDGFQALARADVSVLRNPLSSSRESVEQGRKAYGYFCVQCHGPKLDGRGTVGQSFAPLPADLLSLTSLSLNDGELYGRIRLGFERHPALFTTLSSDDTWAVVLYIRALAKGAS